MTKLTIGIPYILSALLIVPPGFSPAYSEAADRTLNKIGLEVTTHLGNHQTFRKDDLIAFLLTLERDAYITAIYIDADKNRIQIIPNTTQTKSFYKADLFIPVPPQDAAYTFKVQPPYGKETLWIFASDETPPPLQGRKLGNGLKLLSQSVDDIRTSIRKNTHRWYGEASVSVITSAE